MIIRLVHEIEDNRNIIYAATNPRCNVIPAVFGSKPSAGCLS